MLKYLLFIGVLILAQNAFSQTEKQLAFEKMISAKGYKQEVDAMLIYGEILYKENPDSAAYYFQKANAIAIKKSYNEGQFKYYPLYKLFRF